MDEARKYIQRLLGDRLEIAQVDTIAALLGYLPLALSQAGAYMKKTQVTIARYLSLYAEHKQKLLAAEPLLNSDHEPVFVTWDITMEAIQNESPLAAHLLNVSAYFHSEDIPHFLLQTLADSQENNPGSETFEEALGTLSSYSMMKIDQNNTAVSLHRLLQEVIRLKPKTEPNPLTQAHDLILQIFPMVILEDYKKKARLVPHLEAVLCHLDRVLLDNAQHDQFV